CNNNNNNNNIKTFHLMVPFMALQVTSHRIRSIIKRTIVNKKSISNRAPLSNDQFRYTLSLSLFLTHTHTHIHTHTLTHTHTTLNTYTYTQTKATRNHIPLSLKMKDTVEKWKY